MNCGCECQQDVQGKKPFPLLKTCNQHRRRLNWERKSRLCTEYIDNSGGSVYFPDEKGLVFLSLGTSVNILFVAFSPEVGRDTMISARLYNKVCVCADNARIKHAGGTTILAADCWERR